MTYATTEIELWVADDSKLTEVAEIVRVAVDPPPASGAWTCPGCGEDVEGQYAACWSCGTER